MSILRTKSAPAGQLFIIREPVPTRHGPIPPDVYEISGFSKRLQPYLERFEGQRPVNVRQLDADAFEADFERHAESKSEPSPPAKVTRDELAADRGWPTEALELLDNYGFPRPIGTRISNKDGRTSSLYRVDYIDRWLEGLQELARMLRAR